MNDAWMHSKAGVVATASASLWGMFDWMLDFEPSILAPPPAVHALKHLKLKFAEIVQVSAPSLNRTYSLLRSSSSIYHPNQILEGDLRKSAQRDAEHLLLFARSNAHTQHIQKTGMRTRAQSRCNPDHVNKGMRSQNANPVTECSSR